MEHEKLYSPLNFFMRFAEDVENEVYDEIDYWRDEISHEEAFEDMEKIEAFVEDDRRSYDTGRGLMEYYDDGPIKDKVHSLVPRVELVADRLWTVADMELTAPLTPAEMAELKDWWEGQLSDGIGESWEQREIKVGCGELYMEPWTSNDGFFIATKEELDRRLGIESPVVAAPAVEVATTEAMPDIAMLKRELSHRLDGNLSDACMGLLDTDKEEIIGMSEQIAMRFAVRDYLKRDHKFRAEELEFLLRQDNPLEVVVQHTPPPRMLIGMAGALHDICAIEDALDDPKPPSVRLDVEGLPSLDAKIQPDRDALLEGIAQKHCHFETLEERKSDRLDFHEVSVWGLKDALAAAFEAGAAHQRTQERAVLPPEAVTEQIATAPSPSDILSERIDVHMSEMLSTLQSAASIPNLHKDDFIELAQKVSTLCDCYDYLSFGNITDGHIETLLQFENPLEVLAAKMFHNEDANIAASSVVWDICEEPEYAQGYPFMPDLPTQAITAESSVPRKVADADRKPSLLAKVREQQAQPTPPKDKPPAKSGPEL